MLGFYFLNYFIVSLTRTFGILYTIAGTIPKVVRSLGRLTRVIFIEMGRHVVSIQKGLPALLRASINKLRCTHKPTEVFVAPTC